MRRYSPRAVVAAATTLVAVSFAAAMSGCGGETASEPDDYELPSAVAQVSTNVLKIGDPVRLSIIVDHQSEALPQLPEIAKAKEVIVRERHVETEAIAPGHERSIASYTLTSLVPGNHVVSTGSIELVTSQGTQQVIPFPFVSLEVRSVLTNETSELRGIKGLESWPAIFPRWIWVLLAVAVAAALVGIAVIRFLSKPRTILQPAPEVPPHELALRKLRALREKGWIESGRAEPFYVELSDIVRRYIERRFRLRAPEQTTEEFIRDAAGSRELNREQQRAVGAFLEQSDLVKFARHEPTKPDMIRAYESAENLVRETATRLNPKPGQEREVAS